MISQGIVIYDRGRVDIDVDYNVGRFLRYLFLKDNGIKLQRPSRGEHVGLVDSREKYENTMYRNGDILDFNIYLPTIYTNGNAFWLNVWSEHFFDIRTKLGLGCPKFPLHLCIGYVNQNEK